MGGGGGGGGGRGDLPSRMFCRAATEIWLFSPPVVAGAVREERGVPPAAGAGEWGVEQNVDTKWEELYN